MACSVLYGAPGAGKTCYAVGHFVLPALLEGRKVITNIPLKMDYLTLIKEIPKELISIKMGSNENPYDAFKSVDDFKDDWRNKKNQAPLIVVDEAHFCLKNNKNHEQVEKIVEFFSTHRQAGYDIVLITQGYASLPKKALERVSNYYQVKKKLMLSKSQFSLTIRDEDKKEIGSVLKKYDKEFFKCYKSHLLSDGEVGEDLTIKGVKNVFLRKEFLMLYVAVVLVFYVLAKNGFGFAFLDEDKLKKENLKVENMVDIKKDGLAVEIKSLKDIKTNGVEIVEAPIVEEKEEIEYLVQKHPLDKKILQIKSWIGNDALINLYDYQTFNKVGLIRLNDLTEMGYEVKRFGKCSVGLKYEKINFFIDCSEVEKQVDKFNNPQDTVLEKLQNGVSRDK